MTRITLALLIALYPLLAQASSKEDLESSKTKLNQYIRLIRANIEKHGTQIAKSTDWNVNFIADQSIIPYAESTNNSEGTNPKIRISSQFRLLLVYLGEMQLIISKKRNLMKCNEEYGNYLFERMALNAKRAATSLPPLDISAPEVFAAKIDGVCAGISKMFPLPESEEEKITPLTYNALYFVYLHELGHIALKHKAIGDEIFYGLTTENEKMEAFLKANVRTQHQEYAADAWATRELIHEGATAEQLVNIPLFELLLASSGLDCQFEKANSHPMATDRYAAIIRIILSSNISIRPELAGAYHEFINFNKRLENSLSCP
ncbi:phage exclusion protein Lit family protein [Chromobacterium vaccinii]|uniref:phage exclusion protein Lit family protein n=1 Tax=Chromobacterium vaccinii TaxID=1108595 RepID=UPI00131A0D17|nr:phage exclusion protein Lit family protein [Chromobacterium vaccinii]